MEGFDTLEKISRGCPHAKSPRGCQYVRLKCRQCGDTWITIDGACNDPVGRAWRDRHGEFCDRSGWAE